MSDGISIELLNVDLFEQGRSAGVSKNKLGFCALSYRLDSKSTIKWNEHTVDVSTGNLVFFPQNIEYQRKSDHEKLIVFHFNAVGCLSDEIIAFAPIDHKKYDSLFEKAFLTWQNKKPGYHNRCCAYLYEIIAEMQSDGVDIMKSVTSYADDVIREIEMNFRDPSFRIEQLSKNRYITPAYLRRRFKKITGQSPVEYLIGRRIKEAKLLLASGFLTQTQVSEKCGFSDVKYFRTAFKKHTGVSVSQFIKEM